MAKGNFKRSGTLCHSHNVPFSSGHVEDALRQEKLKRSFPDRNFKRRVRRFGRAVLKKNKREQYSAANRNDTKYPIGYGAIYMLQEQQGPENRTGKTLPRKGVWLWDRPSSIHRYKKLIDEIGRWHMGYLVTQSGNNGLPKPTFYKIRPEKDHRFNSVLVMFAPWDEAALRECMSRGIISINEFRSILDDSIAVLTNGTFEVILGGGRQPLYLSGVSAHTQDGVMHLQAFFTKSNPLLFSTRNGQLLPAELAPGHGRRKAGEGWIGGERRGMIGNSGKLIIKSAGPDLCAAVAMREIGMHPPPEYGNWSRVNFYLADRGSSTFSVGSGEVEVTCREVEHGNEVID